MFQDRAREKKKKKKETGPQKLSDNCERRARRRQASKSASERSFGWGKVVWGKKIRWKKGGVKGGWQP